MTSRLAHMRALATFEIRQQVREPLTALYALVLLLLMAGFTGSGVVNLVSDRGAIPSTSAWSVWMAVGGLTAFGQVITTMVATSAVLRDDAERVTSLLATSGVDVRMWLLARLTAACVMLAVVFAAIPLGAMLGAVFGSSSVMAVAGPALTAYAVLVLPTMVLVGAVVGVAAALLRRVVMALFASLALLAIWQLALVLVQQPSTMMLGALLDPFGNAPMIVASQLWDEARRSGTEAPLHQLLWLNRVIWLAASAGVAAFGLRHVRWNATARESRQTFDERGAPALPTPSRAVPHAYDDITRPRLAAAALSRANISPSSRAASVIAMFTAHWIIREGAWRAVLALALANALLNALLDTSLSAEKMATLPMPRDATDSALLAMERMLAVVQSHARVFFILMATVYAGEIVWRERDQRTAELVDALPVTTRVLAVGRMSGLVLVQSSGAIVLACGALLVLLLRGALPLSAVNATTLATWGAWSLFHVWQPFVLWGVIAVTIHIIVRHKVAAHFLIITGWVTAVILDAQGATAWWYRYAEPAPLLEGSGLAVQSLVMRGGYWSAIAAPLIWCCMRFWPRGAWKRASLRRPTSPR